MVKRFDILIVSGSTSVVDRLERMSKELSFSCKTFSSSDELFENSELLQCAGCVIIDASLVDQESQIAGYVQVTRQLFEEACIIVSIDSKMKPDSAVFIKKSGASLILLEKEILYSSKLDFYTSQIINTAYIPIKPVEIPIQTEFPCSIYHIMPLNKKYLPIFQPKTFIDNEKNQKISKIGEVFIKRSDMPLLEDFVKKYAEKSEEGLENRARYYFKYLSQIYSDLIFLITDQSEYLSFEKSQVLYDKCTDIASKLLNVLRESKEPWRAISNTAEGDLGTIERGPAICAYAGIISIMMDVKNPLDIMMGALLSDIGLIDLEPSITKKIKTANMSALHSEELESYQQHPIISLNRCLARKIQFSETTKNVISYAHERADQNGFPYKIKKEKIPIESMIAQLSCLLDSAMMLRFDKQRLSFYEATKNIIQNINNDDGLFSIEFKNKISSIWLRKMEKP